MGTRAMTVPTLVPMERDEARRDEEPREEERGGEEREDEIHGRVNGTHALSTCSEGTSQDEDPDHQEDIRVGGAT